MDFGNNNELETRVDRALKHLPLLEAPPTLAPRVLAEIARRGTLPWYRTSWENWPALCKIASVILLTSAFGAVCYASWQLTRAAGYAAAVDELKGLFSGFSVVWNTIQVLLGALVLVVKKLGSGFMIGCLAAMGVAYGMCVGLGTVFVRFAFAKTPEKPL